MGRKLVAVLLIVGVLAISAAIVVPNLIESRVTSCESAAAASLKSGLLPAEAQFQNGGFFDRDRNGIGAYAVVGISDRDGTSRNPYEVLCGRVSIAGTTLALLAPVYGNPDHVVQGYIYKEPVSAVAPSAQGEADAERVWAAICYPMNNRSGRRLFAINQSGNVALLPTHRPDGFPAPREGESIHDFGARMTAAELYGASLVRPGPVILPKY
jgi:hypothetical protein